MNAMKYIATYKNVKTSEALDNEIKTNFEKLSKQIQGEYTCFAVISMKGKGPKTSCVEITLKTRNHTYRAESTATDFYKAVGEDVDKIKRQINKFKTKILDRKHNTTEHIKNMSMEEEKSEPHFENEYIRYKNFEIMPMSIEDAIMQLETLDHDFYMFINDETDEVNVIYKRHNGGYGVLEGHPAID